MSHCLPRPPPASACIEALFPRPALGPLLCRLFMPSQSLLSSCWLLDQAMPPRVLSLEAQLPLGSVCPPRLRGVLPHNPPAQADSRALVLLSRFTTGTCSKPLTSQCLSWLFTRAPFPGGIPKAHSALGLLPLALPRCSAPPFLKAQPLPSGV